MSERKKQLIYECAAEAVTQARLEIQGLGILNLGEMEKVDDILRRCQNNAGRWAVDAYESDTRTGVSARRICTPSPQRTPKR